MKMHSPRLQVIRMTVLPLALAVAALMMLGTARWEDHAKEPAEPFKVANIHFETNASACDMGIQLIFDTEGLTKGSVRDPNGKVIYRIESKGGMRALGGQTEGFLEGVEPQITELLEALGCEPSDEEGEISIDDLFHAFPEGDYTLEGKGENGISRDEAMLSYAIPAGPEITAPADGAVVADAPLLIDWEPVTEAILTAAPDLGPVDIVGYHVVVEEGGGEAPPQFDVDLPATETSVTIPAEYLKPNAFYNFEVLATEASGNQTISEGFFCTTGLSPCEEP